MATKKNVEQVLKKLSADKKPYPRELLEARKAAYLSQVSLVAGSGPHLQQGGQGGSPPASAPMTPLMKIILGTLIIANIALATYLGVSIYENWDKVQELVLGGSSMSETSPSTTEELNQASEPEVVTTPEIVAPPAEAVAPVSTPEPASLSGDDQPSDGDSVNNSQNDPSEPEVSTPEPDDKDNQGKQLGLTPHGPGDPPGQSNLPDNQDQEKDNPGQGNQDKDKDKNK
jgi:hypothetical protein